MELNKYEELGYSGRKEYLEDLASDYGVDIDTVEIFADFLGEDEDFDGLVSAMEDLSVF